MRSFTWVGVFSLLCVTAIADTVQAQGVTIGPGGVRVEPLPPERPDAAPLPPRERDWRLERRGERRDELRERMLELRAACEDGDRRSCIRFGIIIGENRERRAQWRRENPDLFWWER
jgi:hypothetical protein